MNMPTVLRAKSTEIFATDAQVEVAKGLPTGVDIIWLAY